MLDPGRAQAVLERLSRIGLTLSVDDFGTGYSSLANLKRLPVDVIKIDKSFVMDMAIDASDAAIVRSTIDLAHNLGLRVVAEGVESHQAWTRLNELGCDLAQGFYVSRPLPAADLGRLLRERAAAEAEQAAEAMRRPPAAARHPRAGVLAAPRRIPPRTGERAARHRGCLVNALPARPAGGRCPARRRPVAPPSPRAAAPPRPTRAAVTRSSSPRRSGPRPPRRACARRSSRSRPARSSSASRCASPGASTAACARVTARVVLAPEGGGQGRSRSRSAPAARAARSVRTWTPRASRRAATPRGCTRPGRAARSCGARRAPPGG